MDGDANQSVENQRYHKFWKVKCKKRKAHQEGIWGATVRMLKTILEVCNSTTIGPPRGNAVTKMSY